MIDTATPTDKEKLSADLSLFFANERRKYMLDVKTLDAILGKFLINAMINIRLTDDHLNNEILDFLSTKALQAQKDFNCLVKNMNKK